MIRTRLLIIGAGAAGMAAALSAEETLRARAPGLSPAEAVTLAEREERPGGVLRQCIHSGFGLGYFSQDLTGVEYGERFARRLARSQIRFLSDTSVLSLGADRTALLSRREGLETVSFDRAILATGCMERSIHSLPVAGTRPSGIFTAGEAQKLLNLQHQSVGSRILILGSGDMGQIIARRLRLSGKEVLGIVEKEPACGGLPRNRKHCVEAFQIPLFLSSTVTEIHGRERIAGVTLRRLDTGAETVLSCDTLITAVGLIPERLILEGMLSPKEPLPPWLSLCGNCDYVHEIVDAVTFQGEKLGRRVMEELLAKSNPPSPPPSAYN